MYRMLVISLLLINNLLCDLIDDLPKARGQGRIVGGFEVRPKFKYQWLVGVFRSNPDRITCGGSLLKFNKVITAAHCVFDGTSGFKIKFHRHNLELNDTREEGHTFTIDKVAVHPGYSQETSLNDIAIITINNKGNPHQIISELQLDPGELSTTYNLHTSSLGWGLTKFHGITSPTLMEVVLPTVTPDQCTEKLGKLTGVAIDYHLQFCAGYLSDMGQDTCQGDSGGPLFIIIRKVPYLVGIVSYGIGCATPGIPAVYTRVAAYQHFIHQHI